MKAGAIVVLGSLRPPCTAPQLARAAFPSSPHGAPMRLVVGSAFLPLGMVNASLGGGGCKESVFRWSGNRLDGHIYIR